MALAALLLMSAAGCSKSDPSATPEEGTAETGAPEGDDAADATGPKLEAAIECINRHSNRVFEVRNAYMGSVDPATGAALRNNKPMLLGLYGLDPCRTQVKAAGALTPAVPALDSGSAAYVTALEELITAYDALNGYYEKGEHLDDDGKQAATLHPKLVAGFEGFAKAHETLDAEVSTLNSARRIADLAAREKAEGRNLEVIIDTMMLEAETLVAKLSAEGAADLDAHIASYGKLVDEVEAYAAAHADEVKRGSMENLRNYSRAFLAAAKVIGRAQRDGAEPTDKERSEVVDQYNKLVTNYNRN